MSTDQAVLFHTQGQGLKLYSFCEITLHGVVYMFIFHIKEKTEWVFISFIRVPLQESATELLYKGVYQCLKDINVLTALLLMRQHSATEATLVLDD